MSDCRYSWVATALDTLDACLADLRTTDDHGIEDFWYDDMEAITGLGFVAVQIYIDAVAKSCGAKNETEARDLRGRHCGDHIAPGVSRIETIWVTANHFKHEDGVGGLRRLTQEGMEALTLRADSYPCSGALFTLLGSDGKLRQLLDLAKEWSDKCHDERHPRPAPGVKGRCPSSSP